MTDPLLIDTVTDRNDRPSTIGPLNPWEFQGLTQPRTVLVDVLEARAPAFIGTRFDVLRVPTDSRVDIRIVDRRSANLD